MRTIYSTRNIKIPDGGTRLARFRTRCALAVGGTMRWETIARNYWVDQVKGSAHWYSREIEEYNVVCIVTSLTARRLSRSFRIYHGILPR